MFLNHNFVCARQYLRVDFNAVASRQKKRGVFSQADMLDIENRQPFLPEQRQRRLGARGSLPGAGQLVSAALEIIVLNVH
ncbi:hypothetical protein SDC9_207461 [bioreactor metagenome]|uniref:Uncharacterized protein n=1 Tax=bioreactor metagenome TaxID=1076179 RepID=A0A645JAI4_9ZZZZ